MGTNCSFGIHLSVYLKAHHQLQVSVLLNLFVCVCVCVFNEHLYDVTLPSTHFPLSFTVTTFDSELHSNECIDGHSRQREERVGVCGWSRLHHYTGVKGA